MRVAVADGPVTLLTMPATDNSRFVTTAPIAWAYRRK